MGKKKVVIGAIGFVLVILLGLSVYQTPEYRKNLAKLEQACAELTQNDSNGRVYEPIVGQYKWKSYHRIEHPGGEPSIHAHLFTLKEGDDEIEAYSPFMGHEEFYSKYLPILKKRIIGFSEPDKSPEYSKEVYGICGYLITNQWRVDKKVKYLNKIETLMLVRE